MNSDIGASSDERGHHDFRKSIKVNDLSQPPGDKINSYGEWDAAPEDLLAEEEIDAWIESYRRRLQWTTFLGRTRNRNRMILLSFTSVMEKQRERVIEITYPDLVRECNSDRKTVVAAVIALQQAGHLRCLGRGPLVPLRNGGRKFLAPCDYL